tara:strand:- start:610 stop:1164 length:555 start_codon:yes stop_codon:yes gene_type:complete
MKLKKYSFKKVNSTNDTAIRIIKNSNCKFGMVTSDIQLNGKGQHGKKWISLNGNLFVSFFYELKNIKLTISKLTKVNCLLVKKLISIYYKKKIVIKQPNDILIDKKKICGILQEVITKLDNQYLIVGIGLNITKDPKIKNYPTTNIYELINKQIDKLEVENQLRLIFEKKLSELFKIDLKLNSL